MMNTASILVSVVMPVYNSARFLDKAIQSVLNQSHACLELILVDDGSTDDSLEIACKHARQDARMQVIPLETNRGVAYARNCGISKARGSYIALLDSDDVWMETKLEKQLRILQIHDAQITYCSYDFIDEDGLCILRPFIVPECTSFKRMLSCSVISCSTALVEARLLKKHPFCLKFYHEDYVLWMQLLALPVKAVGCTEVLARYRQVSGSRSGNKLRAAIHRWKSYREALGLSLLRSIWSFIAYTLRSISKYCIR